MNGTLRDRIVRKLDTLSDERVYQVLDYIDFLESKYATRTRTGPSAFQRFAEGVEDTLRAGRVSVGAVAGTMNVVNKAVGVLNDVAAVGKSVATEVVNAISTRPANGPPGNAGSSTPPPRP